MRGRQGSELPESQFGCMPDGQYHQRTNTTVSDTLQARPGGGATDMYIRQRKWKGKCLFIRLWKWIQKWSSSMFVHIDRRTILFKYIGDRLWLIHLSYLI